MLAAAVYSFQMPESSAVPFRVDPQRTNAERLVLRAASDDRPRYLVIARFRGPALPATLTNPAVAAVGEAGDPMSAWRLTSVEGQFEFRARTVEFIEECPSLYEPLHRPFALRRRDRLAVRVLLRLLRLPGGAIWLRRWHARRR